MSDEQKVTEKTPGEPVDTYYDEGHGMPGACHRLQDFAERMRDGILKAVPADVTEHLVNSQKELIRAGIALAESRMRHADETVRRARDLHQH